MKDAYKTMVMEDLRVDDMIFKYTLIKVLWNNVYYTDWYRVGFGGPAAVKYCQLYMECYSTA